MVPAEGHRHNPAKLLMDPYARALEGQVTWRPEIFGHRVDADLRGENEVRDDRDDAAFVPRCVVVDDDFDWAGDERPRTPPARSFVYEAHLRGLTRTLPGVPEELRGTYAGMAHPVTVAHLRRIGVTAVELLPIHAFTHEPHLATRGLTNHWGYNTLGFFAPHAPYASTTDPQGVVDEVKRMVRDLHRAGIEVILDVVYNHTCEQSVDGATLSLRGLDSATYYRLDGRGHDVDVTGCGNTVDTRHVVPLRLVLDSLRHWVQEMHVDGFRFDLAVALGRGRDDGFDPDHPFLMALRADPCCATSSSSPSPGTSASTGGAPASSRRPSRSGTTASATASATSGSSTPPAPARASWDTASPTWPPVSPDPRTSSPGTTATPPRRSTSWPPTTGSPWPT